MKLEKRVTEANKFIDNMIYTEATRTANERLLRHHAQVIMDQRVKPLEALKRLVNDMAIEIQRLEENQTKNQKT